MHVAWRLFFVFCFLLMFIQISLALTKTNSNHLKEIAFPIVRISAKLKSRNKNLNANECAASFSYLAVQGCWCIAICFNWSVNHRLMLWNNWISFRPFLKQTCQKSSAFRRACYECWWRKVNLFNTSDSFAYRLGRFYFIEKLDQLTFKETKIIWKKHLV